MTKEVFTELMPLLKCEKVHKYIYYVGFGIFPWFDYEYVSEVMIWTKEITLMRKADMFFMIQQVNKKREYLDAFIEELRAKGIDVKVGQMQYKKLPRLKK